MHVAPVLLQNKLLKNQWQWKPHFYFPCGMQISGENWKKQHYSSIYIAELRDFFLLMSFTKTCTPARPTYCVSYYTYSSYFSLYIIFCSVPKMSWEFLRLLHLGTYAFQKCYDDVYCWKKVVIQKRRSLSLTDSLKG